MNLALSADRQHVVRMLDVPLTCEFMSSLSNWDRIESLGLLAHLASSVPPAVFASLIGISIGAATKWADYAGSNWTTYATIRTKAAAGQGQNQ